MTAESFYSCERDGCVQEGTDEVRRLTSVGIVFNFEELKVSSHSSQMHSKTW